MTKLVLIGCTHGYHDHVRVPPCDILVHAGDFTKGDQGRAPFREFLQWMERQPARAKALISGNHDSQSERFPELAAQLMAEHAPSVTHLRDQEATLAGLRDGSITLRLRREVPTLLLEKIPPLRNLATITRTV